MGAPRGVGGCFGHQGCRGHFQVSGGVGCVRGVLGAGRYCRYSGARRV